MRKVSLSKKNSRRAPYLSPPAGRGPIALAIRVRGSLRERDRDCFKNARYVAQHIAVPESQNTVIVIDKPFVTDCIARAVRVLASIQFDNETTFAADQINRAGPDWLLPNELVAIEATRSDPIPESLLGLCGGPSQASGALGFDLISSSQAEAPPHPDCFAIRPLPARGERLISHAIQ